MFERMHGGTLVKEGTYFSLKEGEFISVPAEGDYLPGTTDTTFIKTPLAMVLLLGPVLGLTFVIFLPMAVPLLVGMLIIQRLKRRAPARELAYLQANQLNSNRDKRSAESKGATSADQVGLDELISQLEEEAAGRRKRGEK